MKHTRHIIILSLLLLLPLLSVHAQDEAVGDITTQGTNVFIQSVASATLTQAVNGGYTLTLENTPNFTPWVTPDFTVNSLNNIDMQTNWDDSSSPAVLKLGAITVSLTLTDLRYDTQANAIEYSAEIVNIDAPNATMTVSDLPNVLQDATLVIPANLDFTLQLVIGDDFVGFNNMPNVRAAIETDCSPQTLAALDALLVQAAGDQAENIQAVLDACAVE
jgi:hypothetical protein